MLLDNPIVLRELWQRLTGGRLALGVLLAVGLQAVAMAAAFASWIEGPLPRSTSLELGHWLYYLWVWALLVHVSCSAPVRTYGLFDWESRRSCLDQHVITGSSPLRYVSVTRQN